MNFTFGIITAGGNEVQINRIIDSIEMQNIPFYEVIVIGSCNISRRFTRVFPFDESQKPAWITRKKNTVTYYAHHENIVFLHDYIAFEPGWYEGFKQVGNDFKVASNVIVDSRDIRWIDWCLLHEDLAKIPGAQASHAFLLPYDVRDLSKAMYIGGSYWVAKRKVMKEFPLNEALCWGEGEDVEWSRRVRNKYAFSFAENSKVKFLKEKGNPFTVAFPELIARVRAGL